MPDEVKFTLAQINPTVGDLAGNLAKIIRHCESARDELAGDVIIFPELAVSGYPPEDLLLRQDFLAQCDRSLAELTSSVRGITVIVGHPLSENGKVFNALSVLRDGEVLARYRKRHLPNYAVFDEKRYFDCRARSEGHRYQRGLRRLDRLRGHLAARPGETIGRAWRGFGSLDQRLPVSQRAGVISRLRCFFPREPSIQTGYIVIRQIQGQYLRVVSDSFKQAFANVIGT